MLSGCIIFWPDEYTSRYSSRYSVTCHIVSGAYITDWCVVKDGQVTYARSQSVNCPISNNQTATLTSLPYGSYVLWVSFETNPDYDEGDYVATRTFTLDSNKDIVYLECNNGVVNYYNEEKEIEHKFINGICECGEYEKPEIAMMVHI